MRGEQALFNLKIKKKSGLSINPDIHHSKVFSSELIFIKPIFSFQSLSFNRKIAKICPAHTPTLLITILKHIIFNYIIIKPRRCPGIFF